MARRLGVDRLAATGLTDLGQEVAQRQAALHQDLGEAEGRGDLGHRLARLREPHEGLVLAHFVGLEAGRVLDQRGFQRLRVVARLHHGARQRIDRAALLGDHLCREVAPPPGDDLEVPAITLRANEERLQDAARADARQDVGEVRRLLRVAHVERGDAQPVGGDVREFHGDLLLFSGVGPGPSRLRPAVRREGPGAQGCFGSAVPGGSASLRSASAAAACASRRSASVMRPARRAASA